MKNEYTIRSITDNEASIIHTLAAMCPPLDVHTPYTYWVISRFFGHISFIAELNGKPIGFITSVDNGSELLIWQIGIISAERGKGFSYYLIDKVVSIARERNLKIIVSIDETNINSNAAFQAYCRKKRLLLKPVGSLSLTSMIDPSFAEAEAIYSIDSIA